MEKIEEVEKDMTPRLVLDLGMRYPTELSSRKARYGLYECQYCNKEFEAQSNNIKHGLKSCGCQRKGINKTHGLESNKFYGTWSKMVHRCTNPKNKKYKDYGGRGIAICEEWLNIKNFVAWAESTHPNIEGFTLDRIDNDKGYSPENCRFVDKTTQAINRRIFKSNTSGFVGIGLSGKRWSARVRIFNKDTRVGTYNTKEEAVQARDQYIIDNNLPNKLSTDYIREES